MSGFAENSDVLQKSSENIKLLWIKPCMTNIYSPYIIFVFKLEGNMKSILFCNADIWYSGSNVYLSVIDRC